jgi:tetratricopeptide (TPR) repeat protein
MVANIFDMQGRTDEARQWYERVLSIDPEAPVAANNLAWMYVETNGNLDVALQLAQTATRALPDDPTVSDTLGWIYYKKNLPNLALPPLVKSVEKGPDNPEYHFHLGLAYSKTGDAQKARTHLERALKLKPDFKGADEARRVLSGL